MKDFIKTVLIGTGDNGRVFCTIKYKAGKLSISGVEGPFANGDCKGSCGQIDMHPWGIKTYAEGWNPVLEAEFRKVWADYHLNDLQAGSPNQTAYIKANPATDYTKSCEVLAAAGLNPDPDFIHNGKPYKYGSAWLSIPVPHAALDFLFRLPESTVELPGAWSL